MRPIDLDDQTHSKVLFAARLMGCSPSEVIRQLVDSWSTAEDPGDPADPAAEGIAVHAVYRGQRAEGVFHPATRTLTVSSGPGAGTYPSPSAAAMAVIQELNPDRSPNANGWSFWRVTSSGEELKAVRRAPGAH
ncbi:hypothetical protein ACH4LN_21005 [Streptomyces albus]|uniref:Uncharacterized protein n=1 Tax=Streptomyces albus TaxID=1888 RepID=A0A8H1QNI5_9ACTN|nr:MULTISPECIES: hypothetical protein [Streptomyces]EPD89089.1 hypothetical protein HMPREF1486_06642 [Streptomyces sp. HPH0547]TGG75866.1 hypothetical protein D8771_33380 [Streptomyces albus]UVN55329.1 hypothetical protein NR995_12925 [Streptomyces albus]